MTGQPLRVLVVDVGGNNIKLLASGQDRRRKVKSGPEMTPEKMVAAVREVAGDWPYEVVSIGYPGQVVRSNPVLDPANLGAGWCGFDFGAAFERPVKVVNDALLQAVGSYEGGRMLFLGLGTGLGAALIVENVAQPLELAHLPYKGGGTFEDRVGARGLKRNGATKWCADVADVVKRFQAALLPDYTVIGGGNASHLKKLPARCRKGHNSNAFFGGFRLWEDNGMVI